MLAFLKDVRVEWRVVWAFVRAASIQCVGLCGVAAFLAGIRQIYPPASLIAAGMCAIAWTILKVRDTE